MNKIVIERMGGGWKAYMEGDERHAEVSDQSSAEAFGKLVRREAARLGIEVEQMRRDFRLMMDPDRG